MRLRRQREHLYLFQHVAKCAGTSINHTIRDAGIGSIFIKEKRHDKDEIRHEVESALAERPDLPASLEAIHGHRVFYGLHNYSPRAPRYFTFLRDPVARCISNYNYNARNAHDPHTKVHDRDRARMLREEGLTPFREWLRDHYTDNGMVRFLSAAMEGSHAPPYIDGPVMDHHLLAAKEFLRLCFFIGFTDRSERDIPWILGQMKLRPPAKRENVSGEYVSLEQDSSIVRSILDLNLYDIELYQFALALRERRAH